MVESKAFPDLSSNKNWFKLKVIQGARPQANMVKKNKGKQPVRIGEDVAEDDSSEDEMIDEEMVSNHYMCPISKNMHTKFMKAGLDAANIVVKRKVTHVPRGSAAKMADFCGVSESQIKRMGQWNQDTMNNAYLNSLPREIMRVFAGFDNDSKYRLPRATEEPCDELKRMVFPWVEEWHGRIQPNAVDEVSVSADKFLKLIKCLKITILQDAAVMMDVIPHHPIWKHEVFKHRLFLEFREKTLQHVHDCANQRQSILSQVMAVIENEPFPSFERSEHWFNHKVLLASKGNPTMEMRYNCHRDAIQKAFNACNITSSKKTHIGRGSAARMADLQGVDEADIRRMGRWNNSSMHGGYLTGLPRGIMRSLAGFPTQGTFFLPRNTVEPCQALQEKLFPLASVWLEKIHSGQAEQTVAAEGFLRLLLTLRITFLQDSVYMQKAIPDHPIWRHSLFVDPLYLEFKRLLEASAQTEANREELLLQRVVPLIERQLANSLEVSQQQHEENRQLQVTVLNQIKGIATGRASLQINIDWPTGSNIPSTTVRSLTSPSVPASSIILTSSIQTGITYRMSNVCTITDLYREWTVGLGGNHSIEYMNQNHPGWYKSQKSFYMRRNKIMKAIQAQATAEGISMQSAVSIAEELRVRNGSKSLDYLSKNPDLIFCYL